MCLCVSVRVCASVCLCACHVGRSRISSESKLDFVVVAVWFVPARTRVVTTKKCTRRFVLLCSERHESGKLFRRGIRERKQRGARGRRDRRDRRALSSVCVCACVLAFAGAQVTVSLARASSVLASPRLPTSQAVTRAPPRRRAPPSPRTRPVSAPVRPLDRQHGWGGHREGLFLCVVRATTQNSDDHWPVGHPWMTHPNTPGGPRSPLKDPIRPLHRPHFQITSSVCRGTLDRSQSKAPVGPLDLPFLYRRESGDTSLHPPPRVMRGRPWGHMYESCWLQPDEADRAPSGRD